MVNNRVAGQRSVQGAPPDLHMAVKAPAGVNDGHGPIGRDSHHYRSSCCGAAPHTTHHTAGGDIPVVWPGEQVVGAGLLGGFKPVPHLCVCLSVPFWSHRHGVVHG